MGNGVAASGEDMCWVWVAGGAVYGRLVLSSSPLHDLLVLQRRWISCTYIGELDAVVCVAAEGDMVSVAATTSEQEVRRLLLESMWRRANHTHAYIHHTTHVAPVRQYS